MSGGENFVSKKNQFILYALLDFHRATACIAVLHCVAVAILSERPSVCPSEACIVTKLNDGLRIF